MEINFNQNTPASIREITETIFEVIEAKGFRFNVDSLEEAQQQAIDAAEYIEEAYDEFDYDHLEDRVAAWLQDTVLNYPEMMINVNPTKEDRERQMYGCTEADLVKGYLSSNTEGDLLEMQMYAMAILSDVQEELSRGDQETSRKFMNRAKYFMSEVKRGIRAKGL